MAPVVSAALGALGPLLEKLAGLIAGEYGRLKGVSREIRSLQSELTSMHAALEEYVELEDPSVLVKAWISLVRELAYDTEDVFDKFIHQLQKGCRRGGFKEFLRKITIPLKNIGSRRGIADQIDDLKVRIKQVKELKDCYKLNDAPSSPNRHVAVDPRLQAVFADEAHLVGVEGPRDDLAKWMLEENNSSNHCKVLSIVGFGGLGKTTLANAVYHKIQAHFDCWAFVSVSQKPDMKKVMKDVISQVSNQDGSANDTSDWDEKKFIAKLRELLQDKRYVIIIDDIWSIQAWNTIKRAFPENNCSSRIVATTRIIDVAKSCCPSFEDRVYEMEALSNLHSRRLFLKRIFGSDENCPDMLKEVSNEILKMCGGLPLAIRSISSLLANRSAVKEEWEKVKRSIRYALEKNQSIEGINSILSFCYNDLSPNLKTCLLYLSVFPEDYVIDRNRLVRRWIAEGFISEERGQSQQEVAENYFHELINKSMVQPVNNGYDGKARACQVHDLMLEIIITKSAEDNFITVVGGGQKSLSNSQGIIRRLSIQHIDKVVACALENEDLSHVRSLTVTTSDCIKHLPNLAAFEALRVLDFEGCKGLEQYDMKSMEKLFQLKYLGLKDTGITKLPSEIVMLSDLETLDFRNTHVQELPAGFVQLTKLQNLLAGGKTKIPIGIGIMTNLRIISHFNATMSPARVANQFDQGEASSSTLTKNYLLDTEPMAMMFQELHRMTDGFSERRLLGAGAFGRVYRGVLDNGEVIAVKKLNSHHGVNDEKFKNELQILMRAQHKNIIRLVGYCSENRDKIVEYRGELVTDTEQDRALCLEYMEGGTLDELLSDESVGWEARYKIIKGICQGLKFLHKGSKDPIYHLDLKPANVLLDKDGIPKIGDFGLSRLLASTGTFVTETKSGTLGYMPPEYIHGRKISSKFDVFSLGVIIIEIVAGPEGYYNYKCLMSPQEFIEHVSGNWSKRLQAKTISTEELLEVEKCIKIALRCVEVNHVKRPTITEIFDELMPEMIDHHPAPFRADVNDLESLQLPLTSLTQSSTGLNVRQRPLDSFPVDINNDFSGQRGNNDMLVNPVGQDHDFNQAPPGGLVGIAALATAAQATDVDDDPREDIFSEA